MKSQHDSVPMVVAVPQQRQTVLWIIAILLAVIATVLLVRSPLTPAAYADGPAMGARGISAFTGQIDKNTYGLFMMDVDAKTVWCYQYVPAIRKLKLVAARSFMYDNYLQDYQNQEPNPVQVKSMLDDERKIKNRLSNGGIAPDDPNEMLGTVKDESATQTEPKRPGSK